MQDSALPPGLGPTPTFQKLVALLDSGFGARRATLQLVADPELFERYREIAFNAGRLDASMVLDAEDYLRLAVPKMAPIRQQA